LWIGLTVATEVRHQRLRSSKFPYLPRAWYLTQTDERSRRVTRHPFQHLILRRLPLPAIDDPVQLQRQDEYWRVVEETYRDVLNQGHIDPVDFLRYKLRTRPPEEHLLIYHREPLSVAADLAGVPIDRKIIQDYEHLRNRLNWKV